MNRSQDIGEDISLLWLFLLVSAKCGHLIRMTSKFLLTGNKNWMDNACDMFPKDIIHRYSIAKYKIHRILVSNISEIFCFSDPIFQLYYVFR